MTIADIRFDGLFDSVPPEGVRPVTVIQGEVPSFVRGTWVMNGPARFTRGDLRYRHWLDGDGLLRALRFDEYEISFTNRWVRSQKRHDEESAGRAIYRTFGTTFAGDRLNRHGVGIETPVNVSVFAFAGHLLAFGEQGLPLAVDSRSLDTLGLHTFEGALNEVSPFSAHPGIDAETGELINFGISFSTTMPCLNYFRFGRDGRLTTRRRIRIPHPSSVHDFALGPRHAVFYLSPDQLDMAAILAGGSVMDALTWRPQDGSRLLVLDRETGREAAQIPIEGRYCLHTVNCFEDGGELLLDLLELEEPIYRQYKIMPDLFETVDWDAQTMDDAYQAPAGCYLASEPLVVIHPTDREQAVVLCRLIDLGNRDDHVLIFNAFELVSGPVAVLRLPVATPPSFQGGWLP